MPDMNGAELAERIGALLPELPVLLATGYAEGAVNTQLPRLNKPFSLEQLSRHIDNFTARALERI